MYKCLLILNLLIYFFEKVFEIEETIVKNKT
jgi:hypothetical protein